MRKIQKHIPNVLTVKQARDLGVQLSDTPETAFGTFKNRKEDRVFIKPKDWVIDLEEIIVVDNKHFIFKKHKE